ncbi:PREDICTED: (+)-neomenthol dehydrogenase-like [Lupinus angustifolius]|uniref:(+)-neomenthol dehydrogenase-like n=1 Tax=Lupinus angustifolius TaxID=3871 RepID=UPI00092EE1C5|nr:PREDICTED: (+)-neomenthol dehydrogenase-like [Lupinus angustifolius]XP_019434220.1 PREDICTED: (+)-neomenthol dehydrogenase-like [Lupinus angustifolius]
MAEGTKRYAVVTGANKGIGFAISKQLASNGITVVVTARDEKNGLEAIEKLKQLHLPGHVVFHQLDVTDPASIRSIEDFIRIQFGKLDILVNNAGVNGVVVKGEGLEPSITAGVEGANIDWNKITTSTYESVAACIAANYYGSKGMCEALIPLLKLSDSPRIVNVSSSWGILEILPNGWAKGVLNNIESLTEEKLDEILSQFLEDFNKNLLEAKGWPTLFPAYKVSKVALNAYTRIISQKYPSFCINAVCPGYVKTDFNNHTGYLTVDDGAESVVRLALLPNGSPSGLFFSRSEVAPF